MKKLLFLSVMVFGLTTSNGVAKEMSKLEAVSLSVTVEESKTPCADEANRNRQALRGVGLGENTIEAIIELDFQDCLDRTYGPE